MRYPAFRIVLAGLLLLFSTVNYAQTPGNTVSGRITDTRTREAVTGADIILEGTYLWATSGRDGRFVIAGVPAGEYTLRVSFLGYVTSTVQLIVGGDIAGLDIRLTENTLKIDEVVVTARTKENELNTTWSIGGDALRQMQVSNISDIAGLLPGGKTQNPDLASERDQTFSLRGAGSADDNLRFATAVEIDGVRLGNNASFGALTGVDTRNIAVDNIDHVEIITGVPSVEYGDFNSGIVRIHTRKGHTPWSAQASVNPRTRQASVSKGFDLGENKGTLNVNGEWTEATQKLSSPYTSYTRRGFSATYGNTFRDRIRFEAGITGNIGGMNSKDDPDAFTGEYTKVKDNVFRANTSLTWLLNKSWITNLKLDGAVNFNDNRSHAHLYYSYASEQPAVHAVEEGYYLADKLPLTYFADRIIDSKELDYSASLRYELSIARGNVRNRIKAGVQWKADGNAGDGEYYLDPALAPNGYRPRPYSSYPYMHNVAVYAEDNVTFPVGRTTVEVMAGVRMENLFIDGTEYDRLYSFSPRFNASWRLTDWVALRGGWGVTEKLPSFYVLYPDPQYRDIQTFGVSYGDETTYVYYTQPYTLEHNPGLKWQRNHNSELGADVDVAGFRISLAGYINRTKRPYKYSTTYTPFSYNIQQLPSGYTVPSDPEIRVDSQTGQVYIRGEGQNAWTPMETNVVDRTFVRSTYSDNGPDMVRKGVELVVDFPQVEAIRTRFRVDAAYGYTRYLDNSLSWYYREGLSHTSLANRSYEYVGIYASGTGASVSNGKRTQSLDANITAVTHIPRARIVISCRLEISLLKRSQNLSQYNGQEYAFNVGESSNTATGGSIYDGDSYTAVWPVAYVDLEGNVHPFTAAEAANPEFANLIVRSGNAYTFARDGYNAYYYANLSVTKEIGDHVSLSFFANNFTNSRRHVTSKATGVSTTSFYPKFYYGLTCRIKI
ncbi:MAG: TonB-dependent receptor [Rikenellaceae bacterium]|nr:TonB-dependent receptor [Rikenellaceae bacterium]